MLILSWFQNISKFKYIIDQGTIPPDLLMVLKSVIQKFKKKKNPLLSLSQKRVMIYLVLASHS